MNTAVLKLSGDRSPRTKLMLIDCVSRTMAEILEVPVHQVHVVVDESADDSLTGDGHAVDSPQTSLAKATAMLLAN
ncbi:hypothetical protein WKW79_31660 [Variovorax robiniae]|uniref:Uncharacterized protein n=1 Tax=Variovorax robiniae TaxID=1836199 RepID=A0ABU8XKF0_9BURK